MKVKRTLILLSFLALVISLGIWGYYKWPLGAVSARLDLLQSLKLDTPCEVVLHTTQSFERTARLAVEAELTGIPMDVSPGQLVNESGHAAYRFQIVPRAVVHEESIRAEFKLRKRGVASSSLPVTVSMPLFFRPQEQSFLELVSAPPASVYGSHITLWNELDPKSELFLVTGHAASSVCRVASAALFGLAYETDTTSPYFSFGAGVACIDTTGLQNQIESTKEQLLKDYPEIAAAFEELVRKDAERELQELTSIFKSLSPNLSTSTNRLGKILEGQQDWLSEAKIKETLRTEAIVLLEELEDVIGADLDLDNGFETRALEPLSNALKGLLQKSKELVRLDKLSKEELTALEQFLNNPKLAVAALGFERTKRLEDVMTVRRSWDAVKRNQFDTTLHKFVEKAKAFDTANESFSELSKRTGLVRSRPGTLERCADAKMIVKRVSDWAVNGKSQEIELAALSSGHEGCILLPFINSQGQIIEFDLEESMLDTTEGRDWRRILQGNASEELAATAREIHSRFVKRLAEFNSQMEESAGEGKVLHGTSLVNWLNEIRKYTIQELDGKGRPVGTREASQSNLKRCLADWTSTYAARASESFYGRIAKSSEEMRSNPRFMQISDSCLIDSLLRGWKLAFSDDEMEQKFENWSEQVREAAWAALWRQAVSRHLDLRLLVSEGTVFKVSHAQKKLVIRPQFVADISQTQCIRSKNGEMTTYRSAWFERTQVHYTTNTNSTPGETPEQIALGSVSKIKAAADLAIERIERTRANDRLRVLSLESRAFGEISGKDLKIALCTAPERAVASVVQEFFNLWPEEEKSKLTDDERRLIGKLSEWMYFEGDLNKRWNHFGPLLLNGTWPFPDQYLIFAQIWTEESELKENASKKNRFLKLATNLVEIGKKIDPVFIGSESSLKQASERTSELQKRALMKLGLLDSEIIVESLRIVSMFDEAKRSFENWDDEGQNCLLVEDVLAEVKRTPKGIHAALQADIDSLEKLVKRIDFDPQEALPILAGMEAHATQAGETIAQLPGLIWKVSYLEGRLKRSSGRTALGQRVTPSRNRALACLAECERLLREVTKDSWLQEVAKTKIEPLKALTAVIQADQDYDAIDRQKYRSEVSELGQALAEAAVLHARQLHDHAPSRRSLEILVQMQWAAGLYSAAFQSLVEETDAHIRGFAGGKGLSEPPIVGARGYLQMRNLLNGPVNESQRAAIRAELYRSLFDANAAELLKACVYSGGEFFGASVFGRRLNDWVQRPKTLDQVVIGLDQPSYSKFSDSSATRFSEIYRLAESSQKGVSFQPVEIENLRIIAAIPPSFTEVRAFKALDKWGNRSIVKIVPNDAKGRNLRQAEASVAMTDYLARQGLDVPNMLPVRNLDQGKVLKNDEVIITRETEAAGTELAQIIAEQGGHFTIEQEQLYIDSTLDLAIRGKDLPDQLAAKPSLRNFSDMQQILLYRADESRKHFNIFSSTKFYREKFGDAITGTGSLFFSSFNRYINRLWRNESLLEEVGLVHDAITRNYFLDGNKLSIIDLGSDYVGSVGNSIATMLTQLKPGGETWTYPDFKAKVTYIIDQYASKVGRSLSEEQKTEIIQHLPVQPYKMLSSDSGQLVAQVKRVLGLQSNASESEFVLALSDPSQMLIVEEFLKNPETQKKFVHHMTLMEHSLMMMRERLRPDQLEQLKAIDDLISQIRLVREAGLRIVFLDYLRQAELLVSK